MFIFSFFWINNQQYIYFIFFIIFYISAFYLGSFIFENPNTTIYFINRLSLALILTGIFSIINFYFGFFEFINNFRPFSEEYKLIKSRGDILGTGLYLDAYKGFFSSGNNFAQHRFMWFGLAAVILASSHFKNSRNNTLLILAILLGLFEIIINQSRYISLMSLVLLFVVLLRVNLLYFVFVIILTLIISQIFYFNDTFQYYYASVSSLFPLLGLESFSENFVYSFESDKRGIAFLAMYENLNSDLLFPDGPLFFNFVGGEYYQIPSEYFDDLTFVLLFILEYGLLPWLFLLLFTLYTFSQKLQNKAIFLKYMLIMVFFSSINVYTTFSYFYLFFFLGALTQAKYWNKDLLKDKEKT